MLFYSDDIKNKIIDESPIEEIIDNLTKFKEDEKKDDQGYNGSQDSQQDEAQQQPAGQKQAPGEISKKEAQMLIENYSQTEEPQGLLKVFQGRATDRNVLKDW